MTDEKSLQSFRDVYERQAVPQLQALLGMTNRHALPRIARVIVAAGVGKHRLEGKFVEDATKGLSLITGQKPVPRAARVSVSGFKIRQGQVVGLQVTLRGRRMEDFLTRFFWIALPRLRDFRGISPSAIDAHGNLTIGLREASAFPEADASAVETPLGLQVTIVTTARSRENGRALFRALNIPFLEEGRAAELSKRSA